MKIFFLPKHDHDSVAGAGGESFSIRLDEDSYVWLFTGRRGAGKSVAMTFFIVFPAARAAAGAKAYTVAVGDKTYDVGALRDASDKYRTVIKAANVGASEVLAEFFHPIMKDENGKVIGYIAYNGKVFPEPNHPGDKALF